MGSLDQRTTGSVYQCRWASGSWLGTAQRPDHTASDTRQIHIDSKPWPVEGSSGAGTSDRADTKEHRLQAQLATATGPVRAEARDGLGEEDDSTVGVSAGRQYR